MDGLKQFGTDNWVTVSVCVASLVVMGAMASRIGRGKVSKPKKTKKQKKRSKKKAVGPLEHIQAIRQRVETETVGDFTDFKQEMELFKEKVENVKGKKRNQLLKNEKGKPIKEDLLYRYRFFNEIFLKALMELDEVDVQQDANVRDTRRQVIKYIQGYHKELDGLKKFIDGL